MDQNPAFSFDESQASQHTIHPDQPPADAEQDLDSFFDVEIKTVVPTPSPPRVDMRMMSNLPLPAPPPAPEFEDLYEEARMLVQRCNEEDIGGASRTPQQVVGEGSSLHPDHQKSSLEDDREHLADLMMEDNPDSSWMEEEPEEDDDLAHWNEKYTRLKSLKEQKNGLFTSDLATELMKAEKHLLLLNRLRNNVRPEPQDVRNVHDDEENELFLPETGTYASRDLTIDQHRRAKPAVPDDPDDEEGDEFEGNFIGGRAMDHIQRPSDDPNFPDMSQFMIQAMQHDGEAAGADKGLKKNGEPRKRRQPLAKDARQVYDQKRLKIAEKELEKQRKQAAKLQAAENGHAKGGKGKGKGKGKEKKSKAKSKTKVVKDGKSLLRPEKLWNSGVDEIGQQILRELIQHDPIAARLNNPIFNVGEEPEMQGRHSKATQFQQLYANIPEGTNKAAAKSDKAKLKQAAKSFGYGKVKAKDGKWLVAGMASTIYHHQLLGTQWMVERELGEQPPHGGILADSMGLGKTIQTLALMMSNEPMAADIKRKVGATLIVCPATLTHQWIAEIEHHLLQDPNRKVIHYKSNSKLTTAVLQDMDIVVTSYHEVMRQFPFPTREGREEILQSGYSSWWAKAQNHLGNLHKVTWYRIVLDEAHQIKNNNSRTSLACQNLHSVYRWCLTGTPLMNRLEELFPYLRFLKANYSMDWKTYQQYFCDPQSPECAHRINALLSYTMIRRTMDHTILGRPIITLPTPHPVIRQVNFSPAEKIIYRITENRFRANINRFFVQGDAIRNYSVFMVQLLRLRQITSHPWMIEKTMRECWTLEDVHELRRRLKQISYISSPFYKQVEVWIGETEAELQAARDNGEEQPCISLPFGQSDFGHVFHMDKALSTLNEEEMMTRINCGKCSDFPQNPAQTDCGHIFCRDCIESEMHQQSSNNSSDQHVYICPMCEKIFNKISPLRLNGKFVDLEAPKEDASDNGKKKSKRAYVDPFSKGMDMMGHEPPTDSTWLPMSDREEDFPLTPSAKTAALKAILLDGFHNHPLDKVVIYVQFRTLARIVARICKGEGWGFLYLTGDTSHDHRNEVIKMFRTNDDAKILIAGLKCGGLGLNFPWANRCISLDLWWNHAIEQQAFGRIFRIGQKKETWMTRIVVANSVDQRMLTMQLNKLATCEKAIRDGAAGEKPSLSLKQLANLFGFLRTDQDDNILSVQPDYDDMKEWEEGGAGKIDDGGWGAFSDS